MVASQYGYADVVEAIAQFSSSGIDSAAIDGSTAGTAA